MVILPDLDSLASHLLGHCAHLPFSCVWCCQNTPVIFARVCLHVTRLAELPPFQKCPGSHHTVINSSSYRSPASWHQGRQILGHSWLPRVPWRLRLDFISVFFFFLIVQYDVQLQVYYTVIWHLYTLWNDHCRKSSNHLSPYQVIAILLIIFFLLYTISLWFIL